MIYEKILEQQKAGKKLYAVLIDPDKYTSEALIITAELCNYSSVDFIFIGGSLLLHSLENCITTLKAHTKTPLILFPGSLLQVSNKADGIIFLSLISGRNPEFLIGNHVIAAPMLKNTSLEILSTGYILVGSGITTSVEYMSNTTPIPHNKVDIAVATSLAGEMIGMKMIYLEAGSGAPITVSNEMISAVKKSVSVPIIVGGGIKSTTQIKDILHAGADIIVTGNVLENDVNKITEFSELIHNFN